MRGYPSDNSGESYNDLADDRIPSELHHTEMQLAGALIAFHTRYHGWRKFAEEEVGISLDELLSISMFQHDGANRSIVPRGIPAVNERLSKSTLSMNQEYLQPPPDSVANRCESYEAVDLEARTQRFAEELAESVDYCNISHEEDEEEEAQIVFRYTS
jgi:hypothetical protein